MSLADIGGLEPVEDILVQKRMPSCSWNSLSYEDVSETGMPGHADKGTLCSLPLQRTKVLLPLQRPDLFQSNLLRLNKGILLYGECRAGYQIHRNVHSRQSSAGRTQKSPCGWLTAHVR